jgi:hypothetical protein
MMRRTGHLDEKGARCAGSFRNLTAEKEPPKESKPEHENSTSSPLFPPPHLFFGEHLPQKIFIQEHSMQDVIVPSSIEISQSVEKVTA